MRACLQATGVHIASKQASKRAGRGGWAGEVTGKKVLADVEAAEIVRVSGTNVIGSLLCCREAVRVMRAQPGSPVPIYHIFNMGFSRWGAGFTKSAATHKCTKVALTQLTDSLAAELRESGAWVARWLVSGYIYLVS